MKKTIGIVAVIVLVAVVGSGVYMWQNAKVNDLRGEKNQLQSQLHQAQSSLQAAPNYRYKSSRGVEIQVYSPQAKAEVSSPLNIVGMVPGNWSFEAQFPVQLKDASGAVIASAPAKLTGDWETTALVPFTVSLEFAGKPVGTGTLVIQKDNPSGLPANDDSVLIPVEFAK